MIWVIVNKNVSIDLYSYELYFMCYALLLFLKD